MIEPRHYHPVNDYIGHGPRHWTRTDQNILYDIMTYLKRQTDIDATDLRVSVRNGVVRLRGEVKDHYCKIFAEHTAKRADGIQGCLNEIIVCSPKDQ